MSRAPLPPASDASENTPGGAAANAKPPAAGCPAPATPTSPPGRARDGLARALLLACAVALLGFAVVSPSFSDEFLWDDVSLLLEQPVLTAPDALQRIWFSGDALDYYPVTWSVAWVQRQLFGDGAMGFRVLQAALHGLAAGLLLLLSRRLLDAGPALFAATLFAVHPMSVATAAWASELKNTLTLVFALVACIAWLAWRARGSWQLLALAMLAFALSLLSKVALVGLPLVLLALDRWRGRRLDRRSVSSAAALMALALAAALVAFQVHASHTAGLTDVFEPSLARRVIWSGYGAWFYPLRFAWPVGLMLVYPFVLPAVAGAAGLLALVAALALAWRRAATARPGLALIVLCYGFSIGPGVGLVWHAQAILPPVSEHFAYAALPAIACALAGLGQLCMIRMQLPPRARVALALAALMAVGALGARRAALYASPVSLMSHAVEANPDAWQALDSLAMELARRGELESARRHLSRAREVEPRYDVSASNLGVVLASMGRVAEAEPQLRDAVALKPDSADYLANLVRLLGRTGRDAEALELARAFAARARPTAGLLAAEASVLTRAGRPAEAIDRYRRAIDQAPASVELQRSLGRLLAKTGDLRGAATRLREATRLAPGRAGGWVDLGRVLEALAAAGDEASPGHNAAGSGDGGRDRDSGDGSSGSDDGGLPGATLNPRDEAVACMRRALALDPTHAGARAWLERAGLLPHSPR